MKKQYLILLFSTLSVVSADQGFYLSKNPTYSLIDSMRDSVRFAQSTLIPYNGNLACKSSFVDPNGTIMAWHDFGLLEGPGWAANAVGGSYELHRYAQHADDSQLAQQAIKLLDHVLHDGFIDPNTGFITGYRHTKTNQFCLNYQHKNNWFCPGSMAKIAYQLLVFSDLVDDTRKEIMQETACKTAAWINRHVDDAPNGWFPRRCHPDGKPYPQNCYGDGDILFEKSADGLFIIQLNTELTRRQLADYRVAIRSKTKRFIELGGLFGSINHDTYDPHENVAYSVAFRVLRHVANLLNDTTIRDFAFSTCLAGLDQFKMNDNRNGVATQGLLYMEKSWDTAYLWENAEAAAVYIEAYQDTHEVSYLNDAKTILRACAKHHYGPHGFLTEGIDWNNHIGQKHHINQAEFGAIQYTEPLLNNLHIVEPTLMLVELDDRTFSESSAVK